LTWCPLVLSGFPNSSSPFVLDPVVPVDGIFCGTVSVIQGAALSGYSQIVTERFSKAPCDGPWEAVRVTLAGSVQGRQFDRFGGVFVGGAEVLRTSTPEPTPEGITWSVTRDVTDYAGLFQWPQNVSASIPNVVTAVYTGVLHINVSFSFFASGRTRGSGLPEAAVVPLRSPHSVMVSPWNSTLTQGWANFTARRLAADTGGVFLDVFASGHECEEFEAGYDCGTPLRRFVVYVNGVPAGVMYPFPVVYSGGVNPLLWRPLAGVESFSISPLRFDLSPFVPRMVAGEAEVAIRVEGASASGVWYVNPTLVVVAGDEEIASGDAAGTLTGGLRHRNLSATCVESRDDSDLLVRGQMVTRSGRRKTLSVSASLHAVSAYDTTAGGGGPAQPPDSRLAWGVMSGSAVGASGPASTFQYGFSISVNQTEFSSGFDINATAAVDSFHTYGDAVWNKTLQSKSRYRSEEPVVQTNAAAERYLVSLGSLCWDASARVRDGAVVEKDGMQWMCEPGAGPGLPATSPVLALSPAAAVLV